LTLNISILHSDHFDFVVVT